MAIPDYQSLMLPLLQLAGDQETHKFTDAIDTLANTIGLSDSERKEMLPSGGATLFRNRVGWAKSYLKQAALLEFPKRGYCLPCEVFFLPGHAFVNLRFPAH